MTERPDSIRLALKVQPRAKRNEIVVGEGADLRVRVTAPPVDSKANEAVVKLLAEQLEVSRSAVRILRGLTSRSKVVEVAGLDAEAAVRLLG